MRSRNRSAKRLEKHCPRCHALDTFPVRFDYYEDYKVKVFLKCETCRWEETLFDGPRSVYGLRQEIQKLQHAALRGVPAQRLLKARRKKLEKELAKGDSDQRT